jgi:hypothetical protein
MKELLSGVDASIENIELAYTAERDLFAYAPTQSELLSYVHDGGLHPVDAAWVTANLTEKGITDVTMPHGFAAARWKIMSLAEQAFYAENMRRINPETNRPYMTFMDSPYQLRDQYPIEDSARPGFAITPANDTRFSEIVRDLANTNSARTRWSTLTPEQRTEVTEYFASTRSDQQASQPDDNPRTPDGGGVDTTEQRPIDESEKAYVGKHKKKLGFRRNTVRVKSLPTPKADMHVTASMVALAPEPRIAKHRSKGLLSVAGFSSYRHEARHAERFLSHRFIGFIGTQALRTTN